MFFIHEMKMAASYIKFMTKECTVMIKFLFLKGKRAKEIYDDISLRLGEKSSSNSTVKNWVA